MEITFIAFNGFKKKKKKITNYNWRQGLVNNSFVFFFVLLLGLHGALSDEESLDGGVEGLESDEEEDAGRLLAAKDDKESDNEPEGTRRKRTNSEGGGTKKRKKVIVESDDEESDWTLKNISCID